jgi:hypothetical protein
VPFRKRELLQKLFTQPPGVAMGGVGNPRSNSLMQFIPFDRATSALSLKEAHTSAKSYHVSTNQTGVIREDSPTQKAAS